MGNSLGGRKRAKVMKIDGSTMKVKRPAVARDILRDHPGHVLLESEQVKQMGLRAKPLDADLPLKPNKLYFLVEMPKVPPARAERSPAPGARRVSSGINMSAKDRLESLMLSRRTASDITFARAPGGGAAAAGEGDGDGPLRVRLRLPKAQVAQLVEESSGPTEAAERIMELCVDAGRGGGGQRTVSGPILRPSTVGEPSTPRKTANRTVGEKKEKRMRFALTEEIIG